MVIRLPTTNQYPNPSPPPNHPHTHTLRTRLSNLLLIRNQHPRNRSACERANRSREHRTYRHPRDIACTAGRQLSEHSDLVAQGAEVREAAECVRGDESGAGREVLVLGVGLEGVVGDEFVLDNFFFIWLV